MPRRSSPITCITGGQTLSISFLRSKTLILKADRNGWGAAAGGRKCEKRVNNTLKKKKYALPILGGQYRHNPPNSAGNNFSQPRPQGFSLRKWEKRATGTRLNFSERF